MKPKRYDMTKEEDMKRWFREMEGYLKTEDFLNKGTDREGRVEAMDGFRQLRVLMYKHHSKINRKPLVKLRFRAEDFPD